MQAKSEANAALGVTSSVHRTAAGTGTRWKRYTRLAGEYISTEERSAWTGR